MFLVSPFSLIISLQLTKISGKLYNLQKVKGVLCPVDYHDTLWEKSEFSWLTLVLHIQLRTIDHFRNSVYGHHLTTYVFLYFLQSKFW